jgi:hypothetical protein
MTERFEDHIKMDPRNYAMRIWHMPGTHSHELYSIKGDVFLSVVKADILFLPQIIPVWRPQCRSLFFLEKNLRFLEVLSVELRSSVSALWDEKAQNDSLSFDKFHKSTPVICVKMGFILDK